ncbi:peptidoglycan biosynthesis protein MviN/MurJ (putative lipid II flippase) [Pseudomonas psychrotolerans]|nr:peptidoglycan biosynthesis protein MviN/MurJ (putative lipid II flippase) [Pseudomonas psychrotolerans]
MFGSTLWLTLATLAGLVLGFAREWLLVHAWGAGLTSDAFLVALFLPEAVRTALAAGLLSNAALPLYQQRLGADRARWLEALAPSMLLLGAGLALLLTLGAGAWTGVVGAGLSETGGELAAEALKILAWCLPGLLLHGLFGVAALSPVSATCSPVAARCYSTCHRWPACYCAAVPSRSRSWPGAAWPAVC